MIDPQVTAVYKGQEKRNHKCERGGEAAEHSITHVSAGGIGVSGLQSGGSIAKPAAGP